MSSTSLTLRLSQQDVNRVVSDSTGLLASLGFPFDEHVVSHLPEKLVFQPVAELNKLKALLRDCNCGWQ